MSIESLAKPENMKLKKAEPVDEKLLKQIADSLEDIKAGRIRRVR